MIPIDTKAIKKYISQQWGYEAKVKNERGYLSIEFPDLPLIREAGYGGNPSIKALTPQLKEYLKQYDILALSIGIESFDDDEPEEEDELNDEANVD